MTFANGAVLRERLVDLDDESRRLAWSIVDGPYTHHNASAQVFPEGEHRARFVWTADLLPNEMAAATDEAMGQGTDAVERALEGRARSRRDSTMREAVRSSNESTQTLQLPIERLAVSCL